MSFFKLKEKSENEKKKLALIFSGLLTVAIAILWFSHKINGFGGFVRDVNTLNVNLQAKVEDGMTEFLKVTDGSVGSIKETFSKMKESLYNQDNKIQKE